MADASRVRFGPMRVFTLGAVAALLLAACATGPANSYGDRSADARVQVQRRWYSVWVHPTANTLLIQRDAKAVAGQMLLNSVTLNSSPSLDPETDWRAVAENIVKPLGCTSSEPLAVGNDVTREASFACPDGVDLRAAMVAQREALRRGDPLRPAP